MRVLARRTRDRDVAVDLAQEAFLRLTSVVASGRAPHVPAAWLYRVGINLAASHGRRIATATRYAGHVPPTGPVVAPDEAAIESEAGLALRRGLAQLSQPERRAVVLAARGYSPSEIAPLVGRSPAATRTMLCRARAKLRANLADR